MDEKKNIQYKGELDLNGIEIPCYVLYDGKRVLSTWYARSLEDGR